jgi:hypothetical protein
MGPGETIVALASLAIFFVVFPAVLFRGIAKVRAAKGSIGTGGDALRMSELKGLIEVAVERETAPLRARIEVLEEIATAKPDDFRLLNAPPPARAALPEPDEDEDRAAPRARTRA